MDSRIQPISLQNNQTQVKLPFVATFWPILLLSFAVLVLSAFEWFSLSQHMHAQFSAVGRVETEKLVYTDPEQKRFIMLTLFINTLAFLYIVTKIGLLLNFLSSLYACSDSEKMKESQIVEMTKARD